MRVHFNDSSSIYTWTKPVTRGRSSQISKIFCVREFCYYYKSIAYIYCLESKKPLFESHFVWSTCTSPWSRCTPVLCVVRCCNYDLICEYCGVVGMWGLLQMYGLVNKVKTHATDFFLMGKINLFLMQAWKKRLFLCFNLNCRDCFWSISMVDLVENSEHWYEESGSFVKD